ncbi:hypothetical protein CVT26_007050, partial [Gymnopilus dilepis]
PLFIPSAFSGLSTLTDACCSDVYYSQNSYYKTASGCSRICSNPTRLAQDLLRVIVGRRHYFSSGSTPMCRHRQVAQSHPELIFYTLSCKIYRNDLLLKYLLFVFADVGQAPSFRPINTSRVPQRSVCSAFLLQQGSSQYDTKSISLGNS